MFRTEIENKEISAPPKHQNLPSIIPHERLRNRSKEISLVQLQS